MRRRNVEEILESLWMAEEGIGTAQAEDVVSRAHGDSDAGDLADAVTAGLLCREGERLAFTAEGREEARLLVRRHRLAERLLTDVLLVRPKDLETSACEFEHILSPEVTDSICTLLGHPTACPHGAPIPPGPCCAKLAKEIGPLVRRLSDAAVGERLAVVFVAAGRDRRLERLSSFGVNPGATIRLVQRRPSCIIEVDQTSLAIEREVAESIFVRRRG